VNKNVIFYDVLSWYSLVTIREDEETSNENVSSNVKHDSQFISESWEFSIKAFNSTHGKESLRFSSIIHHGFQNSFEKFHVNGETNDSKKIINENHKFFQLLLLEFNWQIVFWKHLTTIVESSIHIDQLISTVLQSHRFAKYTHSIKGQQKPFHPCERRQGIFFPQRLTYNGEMVLITSFTYHLSNSLSELDIITNTWQLLLNDVISFNQPPCWYRFTLLPTLNYRTFLRLNVITHKILSDVLIQWFWWMK